MLRQVFESVPISYWRRDEYFPNFFNADYGSLPLPWAEGIQKLNNLFFIPSLDSIYLYATLNADYWPGFSTGLWRWTSDGELWDGEDIRGRVQTGGSQAIKTGTRSRAGRLYWVNHTNQTIFETTLTEQARAFNESEISYEIEAPGMIVTGWERQDSYFTDEDMDPMNGFNNFAIDELANTFLRSDGDRLEVYSWSTGLFQRFYGMPGQVLQICLEDERRAYILMENKILVLFDYVRGDMMGAVKLPSLTSLNWTSTDVRIAWDSLRRRVLVAELEADNVDGTANTHIVGFNMRPIPVRISTPIPLKAPRQRRVIPVLTSVLGDMNEGVGGYIVRATVSGAGTLTGVPITNELGHAILKVACEGNSLFGGSESELSAGSPDEDPPNAGIVYVYVEATVPTSNPL